METHETEVAQRQLALIENYQNRLGRRMSSSSGAYLWLGVLWSLPIAAGAFGMGWVLFAWVVTIVLSTLWGRRITKRTGVKLAPVKGNSPAAAWGAWLLAGWCFAATISGFGMIFDAPIVCFVAAGLGALLVAACGQKIDALLVSDMPQQMEKL